MASPLDRGLLQALRECAKASAKSNYSRYSGYLVIAAVEDADGKLFGGSNIEVANYSLTKHAEEMAIMSALAARSLRDPDPLRDRWLRTLYVCGTAPCGSCRQFAFEWVTEDACCIIDRPPWDAPEILSLAELLPHPFGPGDIDVDRRPAEPAGGELPP